MLQTKQFQTNCFWLFDHLYEITVHTENINLKILTKI